MSPADDAVSGDVDPATLQCLAGEHPVRVGVLFGSQVRGSQTAESDVDIAVEFEDTLSTDERHRARIDLIVDVQETLGIDDVDVVDLDGVRPAVGASALRTGVVLVGDEKRVERLREDFGSQTTSRSHDERMREFDDIIERLEANL
jgi:predicted nucleotidyltransferase